MALLIVNYVNHAYDEYMNLYMDRQQSSYTLCQRFSVGTNLSVHPLFDIVPQIQIEFELQYYACVHIFQYEL